jgi:hypothetical protein
MNVLGGIRVVDALNLDQTRPRVRVPSATLVAQVATPISPSVSIAVILVEANPRGRLLRILQQHFSASAAHRSLEVRRVDKRSGILDSLDVY